LGWLRQFQRPSLRQVSTRANEDFWALTEREKQTLRLIVRGHDAKSIARSLDLSVHTINERLRDARRKMAVSSSREAARLLLEAEGDGEGATSRHPKSLGDMSLGDDPARPPADQGEAPISGVRRAYRRPSIAIGVLVMSLALGLLALTLFPQADHAPAAARPAASATAEKSEAADYARQWLVLIDQGRWDDSYRGTGASFRKMNTLQVWTDVSKQARGPLGAMISRAFASEEHLPAPPHGYQVVKFRTRFANKAEVLETVTLDREDGSWRVVGVTID
jgi:DNA-binding CsgD family transcriptional regulator